MDRNYKIYISFYCNVTVLQRLGDNINKSSSFFCLHAGEETDAADYKELIIMPEVCQNDLGFPTEEDII